MTLGELVRAYRDEHNMNMQDFADQCGLSKAYISVLERNINPSTGKPPIPSLETIRSIAKTIHMDFNDVILALDDDQVVSLEVSRPLPPNMTVLPKMREWPVLGATACGKPLHRELLDETVLAPDDIKADVVFRCVGDSMINARIFDGDAVFIRTQPEVESGQIAVVRIGDEYTLKRVYVHDDYVELRAENPTHKAIVLRGDDLRDDNFEVVGLAVAFLSSLL